MGTLAVEAPKRGRGRPKIERGNFPKPDGPGDADTFARLILPARLIIDYKHQPPGENKPIVRSTGISPRSREDWERAVIWRDRFEAREGIAPHQRPESEFPTFGEIRRRFLKSGIAGDAETNQRKMKSTLRDDGEVSRYLDHLPLDEVAASNLKRLWLEQVEVVDPETGKWKRSVQTGRHWINHIVRVMWHAADEGWNVNMEFITEFRGWLKRRLRRDSAREQTDLLRAVRPIEHAGLVTALVREAEAEPPLAYAYVLAHLDAGLRTGEVLGLTWGALSWRDDDPGARFIHVRANLPTGATRVKGPKLGSKREVPLSKRLHQALERLKRERFPLSSPSAKKRVFEGLDPNNFRARDWRRICESAGCGHRKLKDLRDTFASWLLTMTGQPGLVSSLLGHRLSYVTDRYAKYLGTGYVQPATLGDDEVVTDLLARLPKPALSVVSGRAQAAGSA